MSAINLKLILIAAVAVAACLAAPADARRHHQRRATPQTTSTNLPLDSSGTPIIMKGYQGDKSYQGSKRYQSDKSYQGDKTSVIPRVSGPITVPPPSAGLRDLPARQLVQTPAPPVYTPPPQTSFSDKVTNCIHSYALNAGVGNNPTGQTAYMGQCVNQ